MAVYDQTIVANSALRLLGIGQKITSLADNNARAQVLNDCYDIARDITLAGFEWPFIKRQIALGLVATNPNANWLYSYRYPINCILVRRLVSGAGLPDTAPLPWDLGQDATGRLIYCNEASAVVEYDATATDPGEWPDAFSMAVSAELARQAGPVFKIGGDYLARVDGVAAAALIKAKGIQAQERQAPQRPASRYVQARGAFPVPSFPPTLRP